MSDLFSNVYNPDVLSCLANLSNDEVFTPPEVANKMLDMLPQELFRDPDTTFLDPACKTGVFLREIAKRLIVGLEKQMPNLQERIDHIFHKQLYGIAITELTSLLSRRGIYCSKYPNSEFSITKFDDAQGNIRFKRIEHTWKDGKCVFCRASQNEYDRGDELETHAYEFIHTCKAEEILNMKFDVVIGNPPYQLSDGGSGYGASSMPLYDKFIESAKKLNPRYMSMIIPARWYAGGRGLDDFREKMINDRHIKELYDFTDSKECFQGVDIGGGVCYFLWDSSYSGDCKIVNHNNGAFSIMSRPLNEFDILVRYNDAINIIKKIKALSNDTVASMLLSSKPFGFRTSARGGEKSAVKEIKLYHSNGIGYVSREEVTKNAHLVDKYKVRIGLLRPSNGEISIKDFTSSYRIITEPNILLPNEIATETYVILGCFDTYQEALNYCNYFKTKFVRFLMMISMSAVLITKVNMQFVPTQDFSKSWTDEELYEKYGLSQEEINFIESMIKPME